MKKTNNINIVEDILFMQVDEEWTKYLLEQENGWKAVPVKQEVVPPLLHPISIPTLPFSDELYISTNTMILYLNREIDTDALFWKIPMIEYWKPMEGVVHKSMKVVSNSIEELDTYKSRVANVPYYRECILKQINIENSKRPKFKDERKVMIGISKKEIVNPRRKQKGAFMNCFAIIIRFEYDMLFREIHVKMFNTGRLQIPGILNATLLTIIKRKILEIIQPHIDFELTFNECDEDRKSKSVLINSNFHCGYYIDRDKAYTLLRNKYGIDASYDPCSYPGVKCKFYFNTEHGFEPTLQTGCICEEDRSMTMAELQKNPKYVEITIKLFRTGNCLVSGNCKEDVLFYVYRFINQILKEEYPTICTNMNVPCLKNKKIKFPKKTVKMTSSYCDEIFTTD